MADEEGYIRASVGEGHGWTWDADGVRKPAASDGREAVTFPAVHATDYPGEMIVLPPGAVIRINGTTGEGEVILPE